MRKLSGREGSSGITENTKEYSVWKVKYWKGSKREVKRKEDKKTVITKGNRRNMETVMYQEGRDSGEMWRDSGEMVKRQWIDSGGQWSDSGEIVER